MENNREYIETFAETFYEQVKLLIDKNQLVKTEFSDLNEKDLNLVREVLDHAYFCNETSSKFHGREDLLLEVNFTLKILFL